MLRKDRIKRNKCGGLLKEAINKIRLIRDRLKVVQGRLKKYFDIKRQQVYYEVGEFVFLNVSANKSEKHFDKTEKFKIHWPFLNLNKIVK